MALDLPYNKTYGTDGLNLTTAVKAYSSLPMRFGKFVVSQVESVVSLTIL